MMTKKYSRKHSLPGSSYLHEALSRIKGASLLVAASLSVACSASAPADAPSEQAPADEALTIRDGRVYLEGDIDVGSVESVYRHADTDVSAPGVRAQSAGAFDKSRGYQGQSLFFNTGKPWPNSEIFYRFDSSVTSAKQVDFLRAVDHYHDRTSLRWIQVSSSFSGNYVLIKGDNGLCDSVLGDLEQGQQLMNVGNPGCTFAPMLHEMGHTAGLIHEHQRSDRDSYITNIGDPNAQNMKETSVAMFGDYDVDSVMHYCAGSVNGTTISITKLDGTPIVCNQPQLSERDILGLQIMYGNEFEPTISTKSWGHSRLDSFIRGTDGGIYQWAYNGSQWVGWNSLGGYVHGNAEVVSLGSGRYDVFVRGSDRALWHCSTTDGSTWSAWESLGGDFGAHISAVATEAGLIHVFGKSNVTGEVLHKWYAGGVWGPSQTGFENLGAKVVGPIEAVATGNQLFLFALLGTDRSAWWNRYDGSQWSGWATLGGTFLGRFSAAALGNGKIGLVGKGWSGAVLHKTWSGSSWNSWSKVSLDAQQIVGNPAIVSTGAASDTTPSFAIFVHAPTGKLQVLRNTAGTWGSWLSLGGDIVGSPSVVSWGPGRLDVFVRDKNDVMLHKFFDGGAWYPTTTGFETLAGTLSW
jgi:hypothetical protein